MKTLQISRSSFDDGLTSESAIVINTIGEANVELALILLTMPGIYLAFKHLLYEWVPS